MQRSRTQPCSEQYSLVLGALTNHLIQNMQQQASYARALRTSDGQSMLCNVHTCAANGIWQVTKALAVASLPEDAIDGSNLICILSLKCWGLATSASVFLERPLCTHTRVRGGRVRVCKVQLRESATRAMCQYSLWQEM